MDPKRVLVVYYSRTGFTHDVAVAIRNELGCDIERISDRKSRSGVLGYLRSGFDALSGRPAEIHPTSADPNDYDLVVVGTPVWNASVSAPVKTYLDTHCDRIHRVAFFCTYGGSGSRRALRQMEEACGQLPTLTMALRTEEVRRGSVAAKVRTFASALDARLKSITPAPKREEVVA